VFELAGSNWSLVQIATTNADYGAFAFPPSVDGPTLTSAAPHNAYFSICLEGQGFTWPGSDAEVSAPWTLDLMTAAETGNEHTEWGIAYIIDGTGSKTATFSVVPPLPNFADNFYVLGLVFSGQPLGVSAATGIFQPNVCIVC
jgi:hypothetical protein